MAILVRRWVASAVTFIRSAMRETSRLQAVATLVVLAAGITIDPMVLWLCWPYIDGDSELGRHLATLCLIWALLPRFGWLTRLRETLFCLRRMVRENSITLGLSGVLQDEVS